MKYLGEIFEKNIHRQILGITVVAILIAGAVFFGFYQKNRVSPIRDKTSGTTHLKWQISNHTAQGDGLQNVLSGESDTPYYNDETVVVPISRDGNGDIPTLPRNQGTLEYTR